MEEDPAENDGSEDNINGLFLQIVLIIVVHVLIILNKILVHYTIGTKKLESNSLHVCTYLANKANSDIAGL